MLSREPLLCHCREITYLRYTMGLWKRQIYCHTGPHQQFQSHSEFGDDLTGPGSPWHPQITLRGQNWTKLPTFKICGSAIAISKKKIVGDISALKSYKAGTVLHFFFIFVNPLLGPWNIKQAPSPKFDALLLRNSLWWLYDWLRILFSNFLNI